MPIHLYHPSRRVFLKKTIAATAGLGAISFTPKSIFADDQQQKIPARKANKPDSNSWILLADTHITENRKKPVSGVLMDKNFAQVIDEVLKQKPNTAGLMVNGDCAYLTGKEGDYKVLSELLQPLHKAKLPVHLTMGNHDHRAKFWKVLNDQQPENPPLENRHLSVLEAKNANWILLDSLEKTNVTPGLLGAQQLGWLAKELDRRKQKPAIIVMHHNPQLKKNPVNGSHNGLKDTKKLYEILKPRKQVKAVFFGHTHHWSQAKLEGIHLINQPPVAYLFNPTDPNGWIDVSLQSDGMKLVLNTIDKKHKANGQMLNLKWRT